MPNFRPLNEKILVKPIVQTEEKVGQIFVPESAQEKSSIGEVMAVGDGQLTTQGVKVPLSLKVGDTVYYDKYQNFPIKIDGEEYLVLKEGNILGVAY